MARSLRRVWALAREEYPVFTAEDAEDAEDNHSLLLVAVSGCFSRLLQFQRKEDLSLSRCTTGAPMAEIPAWAAGQDASIPDAEQSGMIRLSSG